MSFYAHLLGHNMENKFNISLLTNSLQTDNKCENSLLRLLSLYESLRTNPQTVSYINRFSTYYNTFSSENFNKYSRNKKIPIINYDESFKKIQVRLDELPPYFEDSFIKGEMQSVLHHLNVKDTSYHYFLFYFIDFLHSLLCLMIVHYLKDDKDIPSFDYSTLQQLNRSLEKDFLRFYRGQSHFSYGLIPSILRNLPVSHPPIINSDYITSLYDSSGFKKEYEKTISKINNYPFDYKFLAYMQHSVSFSPLLDATKSSVIASVFATNFPTNGNINDYNFSDASIFAFKIPKNGFILSENLLKDEFRVEILDKLTPYSKVMGYPLYEVPLGLLVPKFLLFLNETNDRMVYQKGVFFYLYHGLIVNNQILINYQQSNNIIINENQSATVFKYKIWQQDKESLLKSCIRNYPEYRMEYLMNPYLYFSDKSI